MPNYDKHRLKYRESGNDTLSDCSGADLLHGGMNHDQASFTGLAEDDVFSREDGKIIVRSKADPPDAGILVNGQVVAVYTVHLKGDEVMPVPFLGTKGECAWFRLVSWFWKNLIYGWWTDLRPQDNKLVLRLDTGNVVPGWAASGQKVFE